MRIFVYNRSICPHALFPVCVYVLVSIRLVGIFYTIDHSVYMLYLPICVFVLALIRLVRIFVYNRSVCLHALILCLCIRFSFNNDL